MSLRVYNTLTKQKELFEPVRPGKVGIYLCGPTVYGHSHLGHAKSYISFDAALGALEAHFRYGITRLCPTLITNSREALEELLPGLMRTLAAAPDPVRALNRLDDLIGRLPSAINFFKLLAARPGTSYAELLSRGSDDPLPWAVDDEEQHVAGRAQGDVDARRAAVPRGIRDRLLHDPEGGVEVLRLEDVTGLETEWRASRFLQRALELKGQQQTRQWEQVAALVTELSDLLAGSP